MSNSGVVHARERWALPMLEFLLLLGLATVTSRKKTLSCASKLILDDRSRTQVAAVAHMWQSAF